MSFAPLVTQSDVEAFGVIASDPVLLQKLINEASMEFRMQVGMNVTPVVGDIVELDSVGGNTLILPEYPVSNVTSVVVNGVPLDANSYQWSRNGTLRGSFPDGLRSVVVTYDHGYAVIPPSVVAAVAQAVAYRLREIETSSSTLASQVTIDHVMILSRTAALDTTTEDDGDIVLTGEDVTRWINEVAGYVSIRCAGWGTLLPTYLDAFQAAAERIIAHGAAAVVRRSRFPELEGVTGESYADSLQRTYESELDKLVEWLSSRVTASGGWVFARTDLPMRESGPLPW